VRPVEVKEMIHDQLGYFTAREVVSGVGARTQRAALTGDPSSRHGLQGTKGKEREDVMFPLSGFG